MTAWFPLVAVVLAQGELGRVEDWMQQAFYPALVVILLAASLGVPIPEDVPLIAAGVLLRTHSGIASWHGTLIAALIAIMAGDLVLYALGRRWGPGAINHRSIRWIITPERFTRLSRRFRVHGTWFCFFGRFILGVRAAMCVTAGATHFPYWRFLLADLAGAVLSVPLFVVLGYWFAGMIPTLRAYLSGVQALIAVIAVAVLLGMFFAYRARKRRRVILRTGRGPCPGGGDCLVSQTNRLGEPVPACGQQGQLHGPDQIAQVAGADKNGPHIIPRA